MNYSGRGFFRNYRISIPAERAFNKENSVVSRLEFFKIQASPKVLKWFEENGISESSYEVYYDPNVSCSSFEFDNKDDAMRFKMAWL